jgi:phage terminase Nu1 subunit (DNA packaging protein)
MNKITAGELATLFDTTPKTIADLGKRNIIVSAGKRGRWQLEASVGGYVRHLREEAAGRGGDAGADARARLGAAQATLAETKAKQLAGELIDAAEVEAFWRDKLRAFRNRILAVPGRVKGLQTQQSVALTQELRIALSELAGERS